MRNIYPLLHYCFDNEIAKNVAIIPDQMETTLLPKQRLTFDTNISQNRYFNLF